MKIVQIPQCMKSFRYVAINESCVNCELLFIDYCGILTFVAINKCRRNSSILHDPSGSESM